MIVSSWVFQNISPVVSAEAGKSFVFVQIMKPRKREYLAATRVLVCFIKQLMVSKTGRREMVQLVDQRNGIGKFNFGRSRIDFVQKYFKIHSGLRLGLLGDTPLKI